MTRIARLLAVLLISAAIVSLGSLSIGAAATQPSDSESGNPPSAETESEASVRCLPFGICGSITAETMVDGLTEDGDKLVFVGTSNGLYVMGLDGKLRHFLYSPFGIGHFALIDDITGDGIREVVVALNDTQVPALRCYDGATWEKLWQFAPMAKIWDDLWVKRQLSITSLEVMEASDSQSVLITSGRCTYSVNVKNGTEHWRFRASSGLGPMVTVADLNNDSADEVFVGSEDGQLLLLSGKTGDLRWRTKLPAISANGDEPTMVNDILTLDRATGRAATVSTDGLARLFDLENRTCEWAVPVSDDRVSGYRITLAPDVTPDGLPGILVTYASSYSNASGEEQVVLFDSSGEEQWDKKLYVWHDSGVEIGSFGGKPVILEPKDQVLRLIDLKDGETVVKTIPVSTLDGQAPLVQQVGEANFLLVSSGSDLAVVSAEGKLLGTYPRVANVKAKGGHFVGDPTEDSLFSCEWKTSTQYGYTAPANEDGITIATTGATYAPQAAEPEVRMLKVMDGATREIAWSYEVPFSELSNVGGLKGIRVTPDLVGNDGIQDIIGYREDTVFIFGGKDGMSFSFPVGELIASLDVIRYGTSGNAIVVSTAGGLTIFDGTGTTQLWTTTSADWTGDEGCRFMVLDDLNSDNVSDLAVLSSAKILLLRSTDNATDYELHLTFNPETNSLIEYVELVPDANGDGVKDLAYIQRKPGSQQQDQYTPPGCPVLVKWSPIGGEQLLRLALPARYPTVDLTCGDFDGDGCADSLVCYSSYDTCSGVVPDQSGQVLWIISGRDGATIRSRLVVNLQNFGGSGWNINPPATNTGDVTGDGRDDLAWTIGYAGQEYSGAYCHQQRIEIYDVARDESLKVVPTTPLLTEGGWYSGEFATMLPADIDGDGRSEVLAAVSEPSMASYGQVTYENYPGDSSTRYLAVVDIDSGNRLAGFMGFSPGSVSVFETRQPGILGVATAGGVYYLDTNASLQVTSPADGARTGPVVGVRWEGTSEGEFAQVFVDGVRNDITNGFGADLYLGRGEHEIVVRSIDDYGRILYGPSDLSAPSAIKVTPSLWKPFLLVLSLFGLVAMIVLLFYARLHRVWRARGRAAKP